MKTEEEMLEGLYYTGYETEKVEGNKSWREFDSERIDSIIKIIEAFLLPRKTINSKTVGSYKLKHAVEHYDSIVGKKLGGYVSNGEFIYAMIMVGYQVKRVGRNAYFNVTSDRAEGFYRFANIMYDNER